MVFYLLNWNSSHLKEFLRLTVTLCVTSTMLINLVNSLLWSRMETDGHWNPRKQGRAVFFQKLCCTLCLTIICEMSQFCSLTAEGKYHVLQASNQKEKQLRDPLWAHKHGKEWSTGQRPLFKIALTHLLITPFWAFQKPKGLAQDDPLTPQHHPHCAPKHCSPTSPHSAQTLHSQATCTYYTLGISGARTVALLNKTQFLKASWAQAGEAVAHTTQMHGWL